MFAPKTTFIIGAGASAGLRFPLGGRLLELIAEALHILFDGGQFSHGDYSLWQAIQDLHRQSDQTRPLQEYQMVCWRIRDAARHASSIDNVIEQNDHEPLVPAIAKLAIAKIIMQAERASPLLDRNKDPEAINVDGLKDTWLHPFGRLLCSRHRRSNAHKILDDIQFIIFNYDRTIEQYLPFVLVDAFGMPLTEARQIVAAKTFHHPYGSLGHLPWQRGGIGVAFGQEPSGILQRVASGIQTFTEQIADEDSLELIKLAVREAEKLVFLGFGFHSQNLDLLYTGKGTASQILATSHKMAIPNRLSILRKLNRFALTNNVPIDDLPSNDCVKFLNDHEMALTI